MIRETTEPATSPWPDARALAERLVHDAGTTVRAVLLYGSRLQQTNPDEHSALDFVVVVDDYRAFYRGLARARELHRPVWLMTSLARVLPPNVIAYAPGGPDGALAKCLVVDRVHFERALGPEPPDHFLLGRLVQEVGLVWWASADDDAWTRAVIGGAHDRVLDWMAPFVDGPFDAAGLGRRLLEVCYAGEIRPESRSRSHRVFEAQEAHFRTVFAPVLERATGRGAVRREGERYALAVAVPDAVGRRWRRHFARSKTRTTLRWLKHTLTFANWLPYVQRKVERHTGRRIRLTWIERKLPLLFLWPRAIWVLLTRPRNEIDS